MNLLLASKAAASSSSLSSSSSSVRRKILAALVSALAGSSPTSPSNANTNHHHRHFSVSAMSIPTTTTTTSSSSQLKVIDSHLHVWASTKDGSAALYPYSQGQEPPADLQDKASVEELLHQMSNANVDGALIIQPINHKFDHRYVTEKALKKYPTKFKGMLLLDPSLTPAEAVRQLDEFVLRDGYSGVRFNPYLWPKKEQQKQEDEEDAISADGWMEMSTPGGTGEAVYKRCGELDIPVGVMCFQGLLLHYDDILQLLKASPDTKLIIDHFGFTKLPSSSSSSTKNGGEDDAFAKLLQLASYPQVYVKISALFRLDDDDSKTFRRVKTERFEPLLKAFGPNRLMFGTDFPFVLQQQPLGYDGMVQLVSSWFDDEDEETKSAVMGGTAEELFGRWDVNENETRTTAAVASGDSASTGTAGKSEL